MWRRTVRLAAFALLGMTTTLAAQRPLVGFGFGGGVILGTQLLDYGFTSSVDGLDREFFQEISLDHLGIVDAHVEVYPIPHIALRGHGMWGSGNLEIHTNGVPDPLGESIGPGRVRVSGLDAGISFWPWTPHSVGFAPFVTIGAGSVTYDFDAADDGGFFHAQGSRRENAFIFGVGADMNIWRSFTLRVEAMNHRLPSPLEARDFSVGLIPQSDFDRRISNVSLVLDLHLYLPFSRSSGTND
jgi:hypothetical protein